MSLGLFRLLPAAVLICRSEPHPNSNGRKPPATKVLAMKTRSQAFGVFVLFTAAVLIGCNRDPQKSRIANYAPTTTAGSTAYAEIERLLDDAESRSQRSRPGPGVAKHVKCDDCNGTGYTDGERKECVCRSFSNAPPSPNCVFCKGTGLNPCVFCKGTATRTVTSKPLEESYPPHPTCRSCEGSGRRHCDTCAGRGRIKKTVVSGNSADDYECAVCSGSGRTRCLSCGGSGIP